jgi:uncharacterized protein YegP (UPF0339 family)
MDFRLGLRATHQPTEVRATTKRSVQWRDGSWWYGDGDDGYRFRIEAEDGQLMATSEPYTSKSSALKGVEAIKCNAADARVDDQSGDDQAPTATPRVSTPDA